MTDQIKPATDEQVMCWAIIARDTPAYHESFCDGQVRSIIARIEADAKVRDEMAQNHDETVRRLTRELNAAHIQQDALDAAHECIAELTDLEQHVVERLPYAADADPDTVEVASASECVDYAAGELATLRSHIAELTERDDRLMADLKQMADAVVARDERIAALEAASEQTLANEGRIIEEQDKRITTLEAETETLSHLVEDSQRQAKRIAKLEAHQKHLNDALVLCRERRDTAQHGCQERDARILALEALVFRAATESVVTMSDDPGCFFCDRAEGHADGCPAVKAMNLERKAE